MDLSKQKILVVEDEAAIRQMYEFKLELEGYKVATAGDGAKGLEVAEKFQPDLILLDLRMPIMSGGEMLEKLRASDWGADVKVVVLTNISKSEAPPSLRFLNVERYIVKAHSTPAQVVAIIKEVLLS